MGELAVVTKQEVLTRKDIDDWLMGSDTKLTEKQKALFYQVALSFQLNPAKREVYAVAYGTNFNIITGYEVYLKRAERTGKLEYWKAEVVRVDNEWVGRCTVKRTDRTEPTTIDAWFNEYNQGNKMWKEKPRTMIRKVAIAQAFRMSFPDELGGMPYTSDEMGEVIQAEVVQEKKPTHAKPLPKENTPLKSPLTQSPTDVQEPWDSREDDLKEIRGLIEQTGSDESKVLEWAKIKTLEDISKEVAGKLMSKLYDKRSKQEEEGSI